MYETRMVRVGNLTLGGHNPVWVQSMTNTDTRDAQATLGQIRALAKAGCDIVRVSVPMENKSSGLLPVGMRRGYVIAYAIGTRISGTPSCASTAPSANSTAECTMLCGCTTT